jgi:hypothetical protein
MISSIFHTHTKIPLNMKINTRIVVSNSTNSRSWKLYILLTMNKFLYILWWYITSGNIHSMDFLCYPLFKNTNMEHNFSYAFHTCSLVKGWRNSYRSGSFRRWYSVQMLELASSNGPNWVAIPPSPLTWWWIHDCQWNYVLGFTIFNPRKQTKIHKLNGTKTSYFYHMVY